MTSLESAALPTAGQVLAEGLRRWPSDKLFWSYTGTLALVLGALAAFMPQLQPTVAMIVYSIALNQWLTRMLYPDWQAREMAKPRSMRPFSWAFLGFCLLYTAGLVMVPMVLSIGFGIGTKSIADFGGLLMLLGVQSVTMLVLAVIFAGALLFLPACAAGTDWNAGDAFRAAEGSRGKLTAVALAVTAVSITATFIGAGIFIGLGTILERLVGELPAWLSMAVVGRAIAVFGDMLGLYLLAHSLSRFFVARTGWTPLPLPTSG